jgi:glycosyltransferase involved in cell wall biosynthesis
MNSVSLSFCIPTYNRSQAVNRLVGEILNCKATDIEVVVLDNGSTDDTLISLNTVKDSRLSIYSNGENRGALYNMVNVLCKGTGKYLVYNTDQDHVDSSKIENFKKFLISNENIAGGFCEFYSKRSDYKIFDRGYKSISKIGYLGRHPTGYFFNKNLLGSIGIIDKFSNYDYVDLFPLEFILAELCSVACGAIYHDKVFTPEVRRYNVESHKSSTTNGASDKAFFSPKSRLKMAVNYSIHIDTLSISDQYKRKLEIETFLNGLISSTIGYRSILENRSLCIHYRMSSREVSIFELLTIGVNFCKSYYELRLTRFRVFHRIKFYIQVILDFIKLVIVKKLIYV